MVLLIYTWSAFAYSSVMASLVVFSPTSGPWQRAKSAPGQRRSTLIASAPITSTVARGGWGERFAGQKEGRIRAGHDSPRALAGIRGPRPAARRRRRPGPGPSWRRAGTLGCRSEGSSRSVAGGRGRREAADRCAPAGSARRGPGLRHRKRRRRRRMAWAAAGTCLLNRGV